MRTWRGLCSVTLGVALVGCVSEHDAVINVARTASDPWTCSKAFTEVDEVSMGRYRLTGCGKAALYECDFTFQPPRCWTPRWRP